METRARRDALDKLYDHYYDHATFELRPVVAASLNRMARSVAPQFMERARLPANAASAQRLARSRGPGTSQHLGPGFQPLFPAIIAGAVAGLRAVTANLPLSYWYLAAGGMVLAANFTTEGWWSRKISVPVGVSMSLWIRLIASVLALNFARCTSGNKVRSATAKRRGNRS
jgi:hypothetical protein